MKILSRIILILLLPLIGASCVNSSIDKGREIFFNETFAGNGRTCLTCHLADTENNYGLGVQTSRNASDDSTLLGPALNVPGLEDYGLLKSSALVLVDMGDASKGIPQEFRRSLNLVGLRVKCNRDGTECATLGTLADRGERLEDFIDNAIATHFTTDIERIPGLHFRFATEKEKRNLIAFLTSRQLENIGGTRDVPGEKKRKKKY